MGVPNMGIFSSNYNIPAITGEKRTNADYIRGMSDEELAKYLAWLVDEQACYQWEMYGDTNRISEWRDWLKAPVEEGDNGT